jgi:hypothetical protein
MAKSEDALTMPRASVWFIRLALLYLGLGFTLGALLLLNKAVALTPALWRWLPVHFEMLLVGWFVQLIMGVAYWIFPRFGMTRRARGREGLAWVALILVNMGVILVCGAWITSSPALAVLGRSAELVAAGVMVVNVWSRTRASGLSPM